MELGYFTMPMHPPGSNLTKTLDDDLDQIVLLDKLGYKEAWIGEHFTAEWENIPCPDLFIAKALGMTKRLLNQSMTNNLEDQLELEGKLQIEAAQSEDYAEGVAAFVEKRKPNFKGL